jgi:hypothetical protein
VSDAVSRLLPEIAAAATAADAAAAIARKRALDPLISKDDVKLARSEMTDAEFDHARLLEASKRLGERLAELKSAEKAAAMKAEHEALSAHRDKLAAELERVAKPIAEIAGLVVQIDACDRKSRNLNATSGLVLGHIRPVLAGAAPVIATLFGDGVVWDAFIAVAGLRSAPVTKGKANAP